MMKYNGVCDRLRHVAYLVLVLYAGILSLPATTTITTAFTPLSPISLSPISSQTSSYNSNNYYYNSQNKNNYHDNQNNDNGLQYQSQQQQYQYSQPSSTTTSLDAISPWNINPEFGASPFGLDVNAEVWNGRVAQVSFIWVFMQEFVQGKGVLQGLNDGDTINIISFAVFAVSIISLLGRFVAEPPAGWPTRELSIDDSSQGISSGNNLNIKSNPLAYAQMKTVGKLTKAIRPTSNNNNGDESTTILNFNDGSSPFGFKKNAEIWNGRIAMISFVWAFVLEFFQGEGALSAMGRSDGIAMTSFWCAITAMIGFTGVLSSMEEDTGYVERVVGIDALRQNAKDPGWKPPLEPAYQQVIVDSVAPGTGVSEPTTYERYMQERARLGKDDFASSLKAMTVEPRKIPATAVASTSYWETSNGKPMVSWDATSRNNGADSYWLTSSGKPMASWDGKSTPSQSYGTAYTPVSIKTGTSVTIQGVNLQQKAAAVSPMMSYVDSLTSASSTSNGSVDKSKMSLPYGTAYKAVTVRPGSPKQIPSPGAARHLDQYDPRAASLSDTNTIIPNKVSKDDKSPHPAGVFEFRSSMKKAILNGEGRPFTYRVDGYRFKPETKSLIHPDGVFQFESATRKIIKANEREVPKQKPVAKSKPINYPVAGFRFDDTTKTVIQKEKVRVSTSVKPPASFTPAMSMSSIPPPQPQPLSPSIVAPTASNVVNVISDGTSMNKPPVAVSVSSAYNAMGSSYLDALNRGVSTSSSLQTTSSQFEDEYIIKPAARPTKTGLSYLETLTR